jgi:outer membrane lipoprotein-sorting protein
MRAVIRGIISAALVCLTASSIARPESLRLESLATSDLTDLQANVKVVKADQSELGKINRDFGMAYRLKNLTMRFKEPSKLRLDGSIGQMIINGPSRIFKVPALHLTKKDDLGDSPGKRYNPLDLGLLTTSCLAATQSKFIKTETVDGKTSHVFEMTFKGDDSVRYMLWVDPKTHVIGKREWYDAAGKRKATFRYLEPKEVKTGLWIPTRIEILNGEDVVAGITVYEDLKVNQGLNDSLFEIS